MIKEVKLPEISENVESGDVIQIIVSVGDQVEVDQSLVELETDKAAFELPSPYAGKITEILIEEGDNVSVGDVVMKLETEEEKEEQQPEEEEEAEKKKPEEKDEKPEKMDQKPEEKPKKEKTAKPEQEEAKEREAEKKEPADDLAKKEIKKDIAPAAPSVRRFAREIGVDINAVEGSGPRGRISIDDVKSYNKRLIADSHKPSDRHMPSRELPDFTKWGEIERKPMSKVRQITADGLSYSWVSIPHVTQVDKADVTELEDFRKKYGGKIAKKGGKLTVTAVMARIVAEALKEFPQVNASVDMEAKEIIYKKYIHIGVAVDTDRGLLVPVIRDADRKTITEISVELSELAERTRDRKIKPDEMEGGTFTISNLGGIGGTAFTPIVYPPQVAIIGMSRSATEPKYIDGEWKPRLILPLMLSYDHRLIDGADGARFLRWVAEALEHPMALFL